MSDLELTMMRRVGELKAENARLKEAIADSYKAVDEMEKRFKELEAEFEMHPMAAENARLKAENTRLKTEVQHLMVFCNCTLIPNKELQAKVERLTKAGDAMAEDLKACYRAEGYDPADSESIPKWNAAKEGKHS
jgi:Sec-independent protein translocase protein TatA